MTKYALINGDTVSEIFADDRKGIKISHAALTKNTGWKVKPEGFCLGDICVPAGDAVDPDGDVDLEGFARRTNRPLIIDHQEKAMSLGATSQDRGEALQSLMAPDFTLPDLDGNLHTLSEYRGKKVLLAAYASW